MKQYIFLDVVKMVCKIEQAVCIKGWLIKKSSYCVSPALLHICLLYTSDAADE